MDNFSETVRDYWHLYSDGKRADIPFLTDEDKVYCRNAVAICAWRQGITILVVTVNDTHFHLIGFGAEERMEQYRRSLVFRLKTYFAKSGKTAQTGSGLFLACDPIRTRKELMQKFMYVYRNCLDFFPMMPGDYPWGAGSIYFSEAGRGKGTVLSGIPVRWQRKLFRTTQKLPQDWRCDEGGALMPDCFVDYRHVERLFGSVKAFIAFLYVRKEDEAAMKQQMGKQYLAYRTLEEIRSYGEKLSGRYLKKGLRSTLPAERLKIAGILLRERKATKSEGLARALYLKKEDLDRLL